MSTASDNATADDSERGAEIVLQFLELSRTATERPLSEEELGTVNEFLRLHPSLDRSLGVTYLAVEPQRMVIRLEVTEAHQQPWGVTNGGVYACLGETAASMASFVAAGAQTPVMGTSNKTDFLRPTRPGDVIVSTATPEHVGRTSHLWRVEHRAEATGKLCALTYLKTTVQG
ncbi:PaaI family thioesterase [Corynebacterium heidelbergense]|uniref:Thioesterase domain-containing protein n=1 Tax=Corynebacterium heidelbergense TaxID=2055947 RepID=A0A364V7H6_9CORY|nr:PaaI family thioesterase [Corynebacterium heidelbergense]RAV32589.1 hypothetical protein DLJ54_02735 [Corynebacterium heidelbergense]